jgi:SEC-C motif
MSRKIGRNEPCPCGSGRKYKACCLGRSSASDLEFDRASQAHESLTPKLLAFALNEIDPEIIPDALGDFTERELQGELSPDGPMSVLFLPWMLYNWVFELAPVGKGKGFETTIAEMFFGKYAERLTADELELLNSNIGCPFSLCEVVEVKPGAGLRLFDLLRRIEYEVVERTSSNQLRRGEIIYCATSDLWGVKSNVAAGPYALQPTSKIEVLRLRKWIVEETGKDRITSAILDEFEFEIRALYLDLIRAMFAPPTLLNMDGHRLAPRKLIFEIASADKAFDALKNLAEGESETELLSDAVVENGKIKKVEIPWLGGTGEARKRLGGPVLLGTVKIEETRLVVEVNSEERAATITALIEERLGGSATYDKTVIEPMPSQARELLEGRKARGGVAADLSLMENGIRPLSDEGSAEMQRFLTERARLHWETWLDLPVPALDNMTPRKAAEVPEGRELLESLLLSFENRDHHPPDDPFTPNVAELRRQLGMDRSRSKWEKVKK